MKFHNLRTSPQSLRPTRQLFAAASLAALCLSAPTAHAVLLTSWNTTGAAGDEATLAGAGSANVSAVSLSRGAGLGGAAAGTDANTFSSNSWNSEATADPADDTEYIQFGLEVGSDFCAWLDSLYFSSVTTGSGPGTLGVYTSLDGFAAPVHTLVQDDTNELDSAIDLSGLGPVSGSLVIRLIEIGNTQADGDGATSATGKFRLMNYAGAVDGVEAIEIHGRTEAKENVPEGGSTGLLGLIALSGLAACRRLAASRR